MSDTEKVLRVTLHLLAIPASFVLLIWNGFVTSIIWNWFAVPILQAPMLSTTSAIGLGCVFGSFTWGILRKNELRSILKKPDDALERTGQSLLEYFLFPTTLLGIAWIVKGFM